MTLLSRTLRLVAFLLIALGLVGTSFAQNLIQYDRPAGQQGVNTFEPPKRDTAEYNGFEIAIGGAFTQQLQAIHHSSTGADLPEIGRGFNLATANLDLDAQLADGIRVHVRSYLSSRHHPEAYVKGGYLQLNELPFDNPALSSLMEDLTIRAGHFMPNYGDTHFRRTDNADAIHNPFVGNNVLDAFTTEVGAEAIYESEGFLLVGGFGGELDPTVRSPDERAPSFHGKVGYDQKFGESLRVRLTGSVYYTKSSLATHLHSGDRAGSRYYDVVGGGDWSGRMRSGFGDQVTSFMVNPFVRVGGIEVFGTIERVSGRKVGGQGDGSLEQYAVEVIYRFAGNDLFVGARYNTASGDLDLSAYNEPANWTGGNTVDRWQASAGWFLTENIQMKAEYVTQSYEGYPSGSVYEGAEFDGLVLEAVVSF
ncbi:MAG: hypothetical protein ABEL04_14020 [Salinibacter sp.]|uniref:hypothetical protein n=1 Tax=Salinibacter sp. TaxID=2065818 RepID=UPI0035D4BF9D